MHIVFTENKLLWINHLNNNRYFRIKVLIDTRDYLNRTFCMILVKHLQKNMKIR